MTLADWMTQTLQAQLRPTHLTVTDESEQHRGHGGWREGGETHFRIDIVSETFAGKSRVERQRLVYAALAEELQSRVHALQLTTRTPEEAEG